MFRKCSDYGINFIEIHEAQKVYKKGTVNLGIYSNH